MSGVRGSVLAVFTVAVTSNCASSTTPPSDAAPRAEGLHAHMQAHLTRVERLQKAVIGGRLDEAKTIAQWFVEHEPTEPLDHRWGPHLAQMKDAATIVTSAPDMAQAALGAASLAGACGDCHRTYGKHIERSVPAIAEGESRPAHMQRHQWAADQMWQAVVGNSDRQWRMAARALSDVPLLPQSGHEEETDALLVQIAQLVHGIGSKATEEQEPKARTELLGEFLSTCAACHMQLGAGAS